MKKGLIWIVLLIGMVTATLAEDVGVSTYVIGMDKYDIATGGYDIDFFVTLHCKECKLSDFEIMNGRIESAELEYDRAEEKQYRIYASLTNNVNLKEYPFDSQEVIVSLEHKTATLDKIRLVPVDYGTGIDPRLQFPGWKVDAWSADITSHYYPAFDRTYSLYRFGFKLKRENIDSIIKNFLPIIFLILIIIFTYILSTDKIELRIGVVSSVLIATVMLHITMLSNLPPTSYLTFADKFMLLTYLVLLFSFAVNVIILRLSQLHKKRIIDEIHRKTRYSMMVIIPLLYILFFWLFL